MTSSIDDKGRIFLSLTGWPADLWRNEIEKAAPDRPVVEKPDGPGDASIRYAVVWKQPPGALQNLPGLKVIFSVGAGVDHLFGDPTIPEDVPIVRVVSDDLTMRMSEYVVWQVLDHHRKGPAYRDQQRRKLWREDRSQPAASDVTVGIMGLGQLGLDAAQKLKTLGFNVTGWSRSFKQVPDGIRSFAGEAELDAFLSTADILICLLPLTDATSGILAAPLFARLKKGGPFGAPILINAGRGRLQNEPDILAALDTGALSAASLDVFRSEPLPAESPFWHHSRITITPHAAASSSPPHLIPPIIRQMEAFERGEALKNVVDRQAQY